jgi:8-oxo-dGTP pyrophosphatase MutT (NUDIX family)
MKKDYAIYWVAFKILLEKTGKFLFLTTSTRGLLDLPGGRADYNEGEVPLIKILKREIREELGNKVKYLLGNPLFQYRRYDAVKKIYNLITVYGAKYISGPINLSFEHNKYEWVDPKKYQFKKKEFYTKEEYEAFKKYFKN